MARFFANVCQDDISIFKSILECFSYTFMQKKTHQKIPRNASAVCLKSHLRAPLLPANVPCLGTATMCMHIAYTKCARKMMLHF